MVVEEMKIRTKLLRGLISKLIGKKLDKSLGEGIKIDLDQIDVSVEDEKDVIVHVNGDVRIPKDTIWRLLL